MLNILKKNQYRARPGSSAHTYFTEQVQPTDDELVSPCTSADQDLHEAADEGLDAVRVVVRLQGFEEEIQIHRLLRRRGQSFVMERRVQSTIIPIAYARRCEGRLPGKRSRYLLDEEESLKGDVEGEFVGDEEEGVDVSIEADIR